MIRILLFLLSVSFFFGCKQKGCTDPESLNYDLTADEDDGSCLYCNLEIDSSGELSKFFIDNALSSPHHADTVINFRIKQVKRNYNYVTCGENTCALVFYIQNLISDSITMTYSVLVNGEISFNHSGTVFLPPHQLSLVDSVTNVSSGDICGSTANSTLNLFPGGIYYH